MFAGTRKCFKFFVWNFVLLLFSTGASLALTVRPISPTEGQEQAYFFYQRSEYPRDCAEVSRRCPSENDSSVHVIKPAGYPAVFDAHCGSDGYTVIARRLHGMMTFNRSWEDYSAGFGFLSNEFWIGNQRLSYLTNQKRYELVIDVTLHDGSTFSATYNEFRISDARSNYALITTGQFTGDPRYCYWGPWTPCSVSCGDGVRTRYCRCTDGVACVGDTVEETVCRVKCPEAGVWSRWSSWTQCPVTCGGGQQVRERACNNPAPRHGGPDCVGNARQNRRCGTAACPVHGRWSAWSSWGACSVTCGGGMQVRERECNNPPPRNGGRDCGDDAQEDRRCGTNSCPVHGRWSAWSSWGACSVTCGGGRHVRERECNNPVPRNSGRDCTGDAQEDRRCGTNSCPVHGRWSAWSSWGACSVTCGGGRHVRERECNNPVPRNGGRDCTGDAQEDRRCGTNSCPAVSDCQEIYDSGRRSSGLYDINPTWSQDPIQVYCNMSDGGGWTVIQRHFLSSSRQDFHQNWNAYKNGFGTPSEQFWIGNDRLFGLTNQGEYELRIDMVNTNHNSYYAQYDFFRISGENNKYQLIRLGTFSGTAGHDALKSPRYYTTYRNIENMYFTTYDRDNDRHSNNCASGAVAFGVRPNGGWWYNSCDAFSPNLGRDHFTTRVGNWRTSSDWENLIYTEMKIRPRGAN